MCELAPAGVTKWSAVRRLASQWGIADSEICAVGDDVNDIPMIRSAGLGVAMGNAVPEVKAAADRIAPTHDNDGLVEVVAWLLSEMTVAVREKTHMTCRRGKHGIVIGRAGVLAAGAWQGAAALPRHRPPGENRAAEWIESGNAALGPGRPRPGPGRFNSAVNCRPDSAAGLANAVPRPSWQMKKFEQAMADCNEALKIDDKFASAYFHAGTGGKERGERKRPLTTSPRPWKTAWSGSTC